MALGTTRTTDAVDVVLVFIGHFKVEHRVHIVHVDASCRHIGGDEHTELPIAEQLHHRFPLFLGNVAVDTLGIHTPHLQKLRKTLSAALRIAEAHDAVVVLLIEDLHDGIHLPIGRHFKAILQNVGLILLRGTDGDLLGVTLIDPRDVHHLAGDGGGEHTQILTVGDLVQNTGHIVDKAHVQHTVGLVQHHRFHILHHHGAALHVVAETAGGRHHDLGTALQSLDLLADGLTAVEADNAHALVAHRHLTHLVGDLNSQLAGGGENNGLHLLAGGIDRFNNGDAEGHGLARARRGFCDDILALHHGRDTACLHRRRNGISFVADSPHTCLGQAEAVERHPLGDFHSVFPLLP